jgi:hypothetical protein
VVAVEMNACFYEIRRRQQLTELMSTLYRLLSYFIAYDCLLLISEEVIFFITMYQLLTNEEIDTKRTLSYRILSSEV